GVRLPRRRWHAVALAGPGAEIHATAALAAEGPPRVGWRIDAGLAAGRTRHLAWGGRGGVHAQRVNSKGTSAAAGLKRPSASKRMKRIDTISRWPLISGTRPSASSIFSRS